jgi:hypothetical protein
MSDRSGAGALAGGRLVRTGLVLLVLLAFAVLGADRARAAIVEPVAQEGETVCTDVKQQRKELLVAPPAVGTQAVDDGTLSGSYTLGADNHLSWQSDDLPVDYVLVHAAGGGTNLYQYAGGTKADTDLVAPNAAAIDAVRFCYDNQNRGTVRIVKYTDPSGSAQRFSFHPSADLGPADFDLADGESVEFRPKPGTYTVTEAATNGWKVDFITCDDANSTGSGTTATIVVDPGETVTCTFANAAVAPPVVVAPDPKPIVRIAPPPAPPTAGVPVRMTPILAVQGAFARQGSARLRRPARCVARAYRVTLTGSPVRRIEFTVNGRRVRTVVARGAQRTFTVTLPLGRGTVQRVAARVAFSNGAPARTLRTTVIRCAPRRAVAPQFTG